jgi:hypothetical protein
MIHTLPDPEIQRAKEEHRQQQPNKPFFFGWQNFFTKKKLRLTPTELAELEAADEKLQPWSSAAARLVEARSDPQGAFDRAAEHYLGEPNEENFYKMLAHNFANPFFHILMTRALDKFDNFLAAERRRLIAPLVTGHLEKIRASLLNEYREQSAADEKALSRLQGAASGGESSACIELRRAADRISDLLKTGDLSDWRAALGEFLP